MRYLGSPVPRYKAGRLAVPSWPARAVLVWAVLAGLFLMHGAASPAGGCGGAPAAAVGMTAAMPVMAPASAAPDAGDAAAPLASARTMVALARPAGSAVPAVASPARASCGGMLCAARQPRNGHADARGIPPGSAAVLTALPAPALPAPAFRRACRPPGRPGLPLPLFLSVSRT